LLIDPEPVGACRSSTSSVITMASSPSLHASAGTSTRQECPAADALIWLAVAEPIRVCFVCTGNICRSPTAEVVFRDLVERAGLTGRVETASAGLGGWHVGQGADHRSLASLRGAGYDGSGHRARQWRAGDWGRWDVVVALDRGHARHLDAQAPPDRHAPLLREFDPATSGRRLDVPDPYYGGEAGFTDVLTMIESSCQGLLEHVRRLLDGGSRE
jgi:protein-tyrosine phosphatase